MKKRTLTALPGALVALAVATTAPIEAQAATIDSWNTSNVQVGATPPDGETGASTVYDQHTGSGPSNSQFPFGLFGDADDSPNFILDGFFEDVRTGFEVFQSLTSLESLDYYGNCATLFGPWNDRAGVPQGLFWDTDGDDATDALLMAWPRPDGAWELRRDAGETCEASDPTDCTPGVTRDAALVGSFDQIVAALGIDMSVLDVGAIEDLANLNLNYAISLGDAVRFSSFTLRTTVVPADVSAIPLPAGAPLLLGGLAVLAALRRRRAAAPAR